MNNLSDDTEKSNAFDWQEALAEGLIAQPLRHAIAVYSNSDGDIVIRREMTALEYDDVFIVIGLEHAHAVAKAIADLAEEITSASTAQPERGPAVKSNADRQRRYRARKRNAQRNAQRNADDDETVTLPLCPPTVTQLRKTA